MPDQSQPPARPAARPSAVLAVLSLAAFLASLDLFIVNVAFEAIGRSFRGSSLSSLSWVLNAYAVVFSALLVPLGRYADRFGRRAGFLLGLGVFTAASAACAAAPSLPVLVAARVLQAAGAAAVTPASLGLLVAATPPARRAAAVRTWAAVGAVAAALGPVVGGPLVQASWRWVFLVNVPVGLLALLLGARLLPASRDPEAVGVPDLAGAGLLVVAVGGLALALVEGPDRGWGSPLVVGALVAAVLATGLVSRRSVLHPVPLVDAALLRVRTFAWSNAVALLFGAAFAGGLLAAVLWLQQVWGWSPVRTGLGIAPGPLLVPVLAAVAQRLSARVPAGLLAAAGCAAFAGGLLLVASQVGPEARYAADFLPGWLLGGVGVGLALPTILSTATAGLPAARTATGSAVVSMSRQVGAVLGVAVLVALLGHPRGYAAAHRAFQHGWVALAVLAAAAAALAPRMSTRAVATAPAHLLAADPAPVA